jgi:hypothetical protein
LRFSSYSSFSFSMEGIHDLKRKKDIKSVELAHLDSPPERCGRVETVSAAGHGHAPPSSDDVDAAASARRDGAGGEKRPPSVTEALDVFVVGRGNQRRRRRRWKGESLFRAWPDESASPLLNPMTLNKKSIASS